MKRIMALISVLLLLTHCEMQGQNSFQIVHNGKAKASIIIDERPSPSAQLAAWELQHHIKLMSGVTLPIVRDSIDSKGNKIHIGDTYYSRSQGLRAEDFEPQEYIIRFQGNNLILYGRDWYPTIETLSELGMTILSTPLAQTRVEIDYNRATNQFGSNYIILPGIYDDQASLYATYDFLESMLGVRWYGPSDFNIIYHESKNISVEKKDKRRSPKMKYRDATGLGGPMISEQYGKPNKDAVELFHRRLRKGGEKWGVNHSLSSFQDRFLQENPETPELFEGKKGEYFAKGRTGGAHTLQFCYNNEAFIEQLAKDARDYFDGKSIKGRQIAMGDYFAILPLDNGTWCLGDLCQADLEKGKDQKNEQHFSSGTASNYIFTFVNEVAKRVKQTHPDKKIGTLAYHVYSYFPDQVKFESNVSVSPCLHNRHYMSPSLKKHELAWYKDWVKKSPQPVYLWNYSTFPTERGIFGFGAFGEREPWNVFPGFSAHAQADLIDMYHEDNIRGVFLCGVGEQLDYYLAMKHYDDPNLEIEVVLDEFFNLYFGEAAIPMQQFYSKIEQTYNNFSLYPEKVKGEKHFHQDEELAWDYLGTDEVMRELQNYITQANATNLTQVEKKRLKSWEKGIWEYMKNGKTNYLKKKKALVTLDNGLQSKKDLF